MAVELAVPGLILVAPVERMPVLWLQRDAVLPLAHLEVRLLEEYLLVGQIGHDELRRNFHDTREHRFLLGWAKTKERRLERTIWRS